MGPDSCSICSVFLGSCKKTNMTKIAEILKYLLVEINSILIEELVICETCLIKLQSAFNFKVSYQENSQKLCIKQEDIEDEAVCEMCKENVNSIDCIPLFFSLTDIDKLNLSKFLSSELKHQDSPQTCELCQKSVLNFCAVIKSLSVFVQDAESNKTVVINDLKSSEFSWDQDIIMNSVNSTDDLTTDVKKEDTEVEEQELTIAYEDFLCKNEELDLKTEEESNCSHDRQEAGMFNSLTYDYQTSIKNYLTIHQLNKSHQTIHERSNEIEIFKCHICDFQTKVKRDLKAHVIVHKNPNEIKMFKCHICDFQTKFKGSLKNHLIVHKTPNEIEIFKCHICDFRTKFKRSLKKHLTVHKNPNDIKMFKCHICDFQTKFKHNLKKHLIVHKTPNEVEMFKCHSCDFQTKLKDSLKAHMIVHKNPNEIKMFKCHICDLQTKFKRSLRKHLIVHKTPNEVEMFKCHICDFQTKLKGSLTKHMIVHKKPNEIEMFKCPICDFQTKYKAHLKNHMLILAHKNSSETEMFKSGIDDYQTKYEQFLRTSNCS